MLHKANSLLHLEHKFIFLPLIDTNRMQKIHQKKKFLLQICSIYFSNSFLMNNLISHFHSPGKFLLILWDLEWRSSPPSSLSIPSSLCVTPPPTLCMLLICHHIALPMYLSYILYSTHVIYHMYIYFNYV